MTKSQLILLLLIVALVFYLTEESKKPPKPLIKKPNRPTEPKIKFPSDTPIFNQPPKPSSVNFPAAISIKATPFGLNPPRSHLDEPEPIVNFPEAQFVKEPEPSEPITNYPLDCPAAEFVKELEPSINCPSALKESELTEAEKKQRKLQELSDYHWLLNNQTISDWQQEKKLNPEQYQVLTRLVNQEEMNTLDYFLNLLPANYEWTLLSPDFPTQPALITKWQKNFTLPQTQDWLNIGLTPHDYALAAWLKNTKNLTPEQTLNFANLSQLKQEFTDEN